MLNRIREYAILLMPLLLLLIAWEFSVIGSTRLQFLFGSPSSVFAVAVREYFKSGIWLDIVITASEAIFGLVIGSVIGVFLGVLLWSNQRIERIAKPYITCVAAIPVFALAPILIIWFGVGFLPKVVMSAFGVFAIAIVHTFEGFRATANEHIEYAQVIGARKIDVIYKVLLPSAFQWLIASSQINVGIAILGAFIAEFVSSKAGLGHFIIEAGQLYDMPSVIFGIINLSLLALAITYSIRMLAENFCCWSLGLDTA